MPENDAKNVEQSDDLVGLIRRRYKFMVDGDNENRDEAMYDLKFVHEPGFQWEHNMVNGS